MVNPTNLTSSFDPIVLVQLHGDIVIRTSNFGQVAGQESIRFLRQSVTLYSSSRLTQSATPWDIEHRFSFALPTYVQIKGQRTPLPASFTAFLLGTDCGISYVLKIDMVRKGFRRHETWVFPRCTKFDKGHSQAPSIRVPISYLPKSSPSHPSVMELPWPSENTSLIPFHGDDRVRTEMLHEYWPLKNSSPTETQSKSQSIYVRILSLSVRSAFISPLSSIALPAVSSRFYFRRTHTVRVKPRVPALASTPKTFDPEHPDRTD